MKRKPSSASSYNIDILRAGAVFGLSLGLRIYIIGVLFGGWLDRRLSSAPAFLMAGVLIAIILSFYFLIRDFNLAVRKQSQPPVGPGCPEEYEPELSDNLGDACEKNGHDHLDKEE